MHTPSNKWGYCITACLVSGECVLICRESLYISVVRQRAIKVEEKLWTDTQTCFCLRYTTVNRPWVFSLVKTALLSEFQLFCSLCFSSSFSLSVTFLSFLCPLRLLCAQACCPVQGSIWKWLESTVVAMAVQLARCGSGERPAFPLLCYLWVWRGNWE